MWLSLHAYLLRLIWLCVLPPVLLAAFLAYDSVRVLRKERQVEADNLARNFAAAVDQNLRARIGALHILAKSSHANGPDTWRDLYEEARAFRDSFGGELVYADRDLRMLFNTRVPYGTGLPPLPRPEGRAAAPTALATGKPEVGDLFMGPLAKEPLIGIAYPVIESGVAQYVLISITEAKQYQERIERVALPDGWALSLLDGTGMPIARRGPPVSPGDGAAQRFVARPGVSSWSVELAIPQSVDRELWVAAAIKLALVVLGAMVAGVAAGWLAGRRLRASVASLTGDQPARAPAISELAAVRSMLDDSAQQRADAQTARDESDRRFQATFQQAAVGIALVAPDGRWLQVNDRLCAILGYSRDELFARTFQDVTYPEDLHRDLEQVRQMLSGEIATYSMEKRYIRRNGSTVWANLTVALVRRADGSPDYFISVVEDIQRRKDGEAALKDSEARLREAQRVAGIGNWTWNVRDGAVQWSPEIYRIFGRDPALGPITFPAVESAFASESWGRLSPAVQACLTAGIPYDLDVEVIRPDGEHRWVNSHGAAARDAAGEIVELRGTIQDITERHQAEEQVSRALRGAIGALSATVDQRDPYTAGHQRRVAQLAVAIAEDLGLDEPRREGIRVAALLHDIGVTAVPAEIFSRPRRLTANEFELIKGHVTAGYEIVRAVQFPWPVADAILQHHERLDGSGYPGGLAGDAICLEARIIGVCDVVEAMSSHRPWRAALGPDAALTEITDRSGTAFDPAVVASCVRLFREKGFEFS